MRFKLPKFSLKKICIVVLSVLVLSLMLERFINRGTILGYQVRHVNSPIADSADSVQDSLACSKVDAAKVGKVIGVKAERIAANLGDKKDPTFISICSYKTAQNQPRFVTLVIRDSKNEDTATKQMVSYSKRSGVTPVKLGSEAYYLSVQNQIVVRDGKRIVTVTVSPPTDASKVSSKEAATELASSLL